MRLGNSSLEQARVLLTQSEKMVKRVMDIASEEDDYTVMSEAADIVTKLSILNKAILERRDHVSITDRYNLYGDVFEPSEDDLIEKELDEGCCEDSCDCAYNDCCSEDDKADVNTLIHDFIIALQDVMSKSSHDEEGKSK